MANKRGGQLGNKNAANFRMFEGAVRAALHQDRSALRDIAAELVKKAKAGEPWAIQMLADRLDGKPKQTIDGKIDHEHTHRAEPVQESLDWLAGVVGPGPKAPKSLPN